MAGEYDLPDLIGTIPSVGRRQKAMSRRITVEPVIFLAMIGYGTVGTTRTQYVRDRIAMDEYNYTFDDTNSSCFLNESDYGYHMEQEIQSKAATFTMLLSLCSYILPVFSAIIIGTWSDKHRRKFALFCPVLGMTIQSAIYLCIISLHLPLEVAFAAEVAQGSLGGLPLLLSACLAYIADVTDSSRRMIRIVIVEISMLVAIGGSQVGIGFLIETVGFAPPFYFILSFLILDLCYIIVPPFLIETIEKPPEAGSVKAELKDMVQEMYLLFKNNTNGRRSKLVALGGISFVTTLLITGYLNTVALFALDDPFCWTPDILGVFIAASLAAGGIGLAVGAKLFSLCLSDFWIIQIGNLSLLFSMITISFVNATAGIFMSSLGGCLKTLAPPVVRAKMSKTVDEKEQGNVVTGLTYLLIVGSVCSLLSMRIENMVLRMLCSTLRRWTQAASVFRVMFAFQTSAEGIAMFASPLILQSIYAATVEYDSHVCFYVASVIGAIPIFLTLLLQYKSKKESNAYNMMDAPNEIAPQIGSINKNL